MTIAADNVEVIQGALWALYVMSALLTLRAGISGSWVTLWVAAILSAVASLLWIWSIGSLLFLLPCVQLALAMALRRSADLRRGAMLLSAGIVTFAVVIYGLAIFRAQDVWLVAVPLAFVMWSLALFRNGHVAARRSS
jgi:hypothetical protein